MAFWTSPEPGVRLHGAYAPSTLGADDAGKTSFMGTAGIGVDLFPLGERGGLFTELGFNAFTAPMEEEFVEGGTVLMPKVLVGVRFPLR